MLSAQTRIGAIVPTLVYLQGRFLFENFAADIASVTVF